MNLGSPLAQLGDLKLGVELGKCRTEERGPVVWDQERGQLQPEASDPAGAIRHFISPGFSAQYRWGLL